MRFPAAIKLWNLLRFDKITVDYKKAFPFFRTRCSTHASNFTPSVREFGEFDPHMQLGQLLQCSVQRVCLLAVTWSNTLNIAVNHRLITWGATFPCCQMCWLLVHPHTSPPKTRCNRIDLPGNFQVSRWINPPWIVIILSEPIPFPSDRSRLALWRQIDCKRYRIV